MKIKKIKPQIPTKEQLLEFIELQSRPVSKREIARAFKIKGSDRILLKALMKDLIAKGIISDQGGLVRKGRPKPNIQVDRGIRKNGSLATFSLVGCFEKTAHGACITPSDRHIREQFIVEDASIAESGDLVVAEITRLRRYSPPKVRIIKKIGKIDNPSDLSEIAIHHYNLPQKFSEQANNLAKQAKIPNLQDREDLRGIPLVTIDDESARDFDDAVWAEPDSSNPGGWHAVVAIADVAYYVRPGDALDVMARERGNSVYLPDQVVPMLPKALSNHMCSLVPNEDRACLAVHLWIDKNGKLLKHHFVRGLIRSAARFTYQQIQAAYEGKNKDADIGLIKPLYGVFNSLLKDRKRRGTLEFDLPERRIELDENSKIEAVNTKDRYDSHRLIEELMIAANVAAAKEIERIGQQCMYRVHDSPDPLKILELRTVMKGLGFKLPQGYEIKAQALTELVQKARETPHEQVISNLVLRAQSQAVYSDKNIGHFGLQLERYCHFTSPIRRYSDLLVHRALITGLKLGEGSFTDVDQVNFRDIGTEISETGRRAMFAERDTNDRFIALFMASQIGQKFQGLISGVSKFGLFITVEDTGANGFVPIRSLTDDFYHYNATLHQLMGRRSRRKYSLGDKIYVKLKTSIPLTGSLEFGVITPKGRKNSRKITFN